MARLGRHFLPDQPLHVIQRGNDRAPILFVDEDYGPYRTWLVEAAPLPKGRPRKERDSGRQGRLL